MNRISNKYLLHGIRILIGAVFVASAVFKMMGIDTFEIYVFSLQWFGLPLSSILARLLISGEFILGCLLITNINFSVVKKITAAVCILFSVFLILQIIQGKTENCHCFGEIIQLSPIASLIKNGIILLLLFFIYKGVEFNIKYGASIKLFVVCFALIFPMAISPPDFMIKWQPVSEEVLQIADKRMKSDSTLMASGAGEGKKIICFLSVQCNYCVNAANKISIVAKNEKINDKVLFVFTGDINKLDEFWKKSNATHFNYVFMPMRPFFQIAGPSVPSIYLSENGNFVEQFNFRTINEKTISNFFKNP